MMSGQSPSATFPSSTHPSARAIVKGLVRGGVKHIVSSPGSRNAPLVLACHHHPDMEIVVSIDERSGAHHALGIAMGTGQPVAVICTSGTAALNHGPALAEAFHARLPLISITADRPVDAIGKGHGQSIVQRGVHRHHVVHEDVLDEAQLDESVLLARVEQAVSQSKQGGPGQTPGPVHLNVPLEEPLYDLQDLELEVDNQACDNSAQAEYRYDQFEGSQTDGRILVLAGNRPLASQGGVATHLNTNLPCLAERGAHMSGPHVIHGADRLIQNGALPDHLMPTAVLTVGLPPMSKSWRKAFQGLPHWHVGEPGWDMWNCLKGTLPLSVLDSMKPEASFVEEWMRQADRLQSSSRHAPEEWSDLRAWIELSQGWKRLDESRKPSALHLANSASARYAQWVNLEGALRQGAPVMANRGVAGIDGCVSTALGWQMANPTSDAWMVCGDLAFHYDINAWMMDTPQAMKGLKVVVMNNGGGGIFRWLPGRDREGFERLFETPPNRTVGDVCRLIGAKHWQVRSAEEVSRAVQEVALHDGNAVLEICTPNDTSADVLHQHLSSFHRP